MINDRQGMYIYYIYYTWRTACQDEKPKMTPANNYAARYKGIAIVGNSDLV